MRFDPLLQGVNTVILDFPGGQAQKEKEVILPVILPATTRLYCH